MMFLLSTVLAVALAASNTAYVGIGDRLVRGAGVETALPITAAAAKQAGWKAADAVTCVPGVGIRYFKSADGLVTNEEPMGLGFTPFGRKIERREKFFSDPLSELTSITVYMDGTAAPQLISKGWWVKESDKMHAVTLSLRSSADSCAKEPLAAPVGDRVQVNAAALNFTVPLTTPDKKMYHQGSCVKKMGVHWLHDISKPGSMSWKHGNLAPVVPMFDPFTGQINAVFITAPDVQQRLTSRRGWDAIPLTKHLMCANLCDQKCTFDEFFLSTMHIFFKDPKTLNCQLPCGKIKCCADSDKSWFREEGDEEVTTIAADVTTLSGSSASASVASAVAVAAAAIAL
jgi:hypothetical protein